MNFTTQLLHALLALLLFTFTVQPVDAGTVTVTIGEFGPDNNVFMKWEGSLDALPNNSGPAICLSPVLSYSNTAFYVFGNTPFNCK